MSGDFGVFGNVGPIVIQDGPGSLFRQSRWGDMVVSQGQPQMSEAAGRGQFFWAGTLAAGVAPGTAIGTAAAYALYNPLQSGVRLAIKKVRFAFVSGTLGQGVLYHCLAQGPVTAAPSGTALNVMNANGVLPPGGSKSSTLAFSAATLAANPLIIGPFLSLPPETSSITYGLVAAVDDIDGEISVGQGGLYAIEGVAAAGTAPLIAISVSWQEIAV